MNEIPIQTFQEAIRSTHGAEAILKRREKVRETFRGRTVWDGEVLVFRLQNHPTAQLCYAWEVDGRVTAVLGEDPIKSARDAVRAAIVSEEETRDGSG